MKKSVQKSALLFTSMVALAAFAMPAAASAVVWGPVNTTGALDGPVSTQSAALGLGFTCTQHLAIHTRTPASSTMDITGATYSACTGQSSVASCAITPVATGLPWTASALSTSNVALNGFNVNVTFSGATCPISGSLPWTGTVAGGVWNAATHTVTYTSATGLTLGGYPVPYSGTLRNPTQNLTLS